MFDASTETLEVAQAIHSLYERWSVDVFLSVVAMDVFLHLAEQAKLEWEMKWSALSVGRLKIPAYIGRVSLKSVAKTLSLIGFGAAIALEFVAVPYGERVDDLTGREATKSQKQVIAALVTATKANKDSGEAKARAGKLEVQAATLRKQAEDERIARVRLQERVAWRTISPSDIKAIGSRLRSHRVARIAISTVADNEEAISFSQDVGAVIVAAGWPLSGIGVMSNLGAQRFGVQISTTRDEETRSAAYALSSELDKLGFSPARVEEADEVFNASKAPGIYVFVELRPRIVPIKDATKMMP